MSNSKGFTNTSKEYLLYKIESLESQNNILIKDLKLLKSMYDYTFQVRIYMIQRIRLFKCWIWILISLIILEFIALYIYYIFAILKL